MKKPLSAMECALAGVFDYAGMFPPAELDLRAVVRHYLEYRRGGYGWALGRLVIDAKVLSALRAEAQGDASRLSLSVVAKDANPEAIQQHLDDGLPIAMLEVKATDRDEILRLKESLPAGIAACVEVSIETTDANVLDAIGIAGVNAKLRMGGVVAEAFPTAASVAAMLKVLAKRRIAFKATAGLHHPLRARHPFTYQQDSPAGLMHGFMNLLCASALVWFGGEVNEATQLLEEQGSASLASGSRCHLLALIWLE